jgi:hypothetical protein
MPGRLPPPEGSLPLLEIDRDDTDPDVFGRQSAPDQRGDTVPRCVSCGRRVDDPSQFDQGVTWALQGVNWMLRNAGPAGQRMTKAEADNLTLWFQQGLS